LLLSTRKTESFSVQNTIEKKSHKTPALLLSVAATITYPLSLMYFKSPNGLSAFCFCLKIFPEMFRVVLTSVSYFILIKSVCQPSFIFDDITNCFVRRQYVMVFTLNISFPEFTFLPNQIMNAGTYRLFPCWFFHD